MSSQEYQNVASWQRPAGLVEVCSRNRRLVAVVNTAAQSHST